MNPATMSRGNRHGIASVFRYRRWRSPDPDPCFWLAAAIRFAREQAVAMLILLCVGGGYFVLSILRPGREGFFLCCSRRRRFISLPNI
jgi:hypothetical protein